LDDVSKERTEEASVGHARQLQHDRQVADFTSTISRLQAALRDFKKAESSSQFDVSTSSTVGDGEARLQVASLSDQVMRQQTKIDTCTSEIRALKSRLRTAISRAEKAETEAMSLSHGNNSVDMEIGGLDTGMRRRGGGRIKESQSPSLGSIRSAMKFHPGQVGEGKEKIGLAIDALDNFSVETGKHW
jgi:chromosome segregation ATPase